MTLIEIQNLIQNNQLKQAQKMLEECTYEEKQSPQFDKLNNSLHKKLTKVRQSLVIQYIKKCKEYLKHNQLNEAYQLLQDLVRIDPNNAKVINLKNTVVAKINKQLAKDSQLKIKQVKQQTEALIKQNKTQEALDLVYQINNIPKPLLEELEIQTKRVIIDFKLKTNKNKLKATPTPQKYDFIKKLFDLENTYPAIQKELLKTSQELQHYSKTQKKVFIKELINQSKILLNQKKFIKAKQTAVKVLKIQPTNKQATKLYKQAINKYHTDSFIQAYKILKSKKAS